MRGHTCYGSEVFGDTFQRSIVFAHAITININYKVMKTILYSLRAQRKYLVGKF